MKKVNTLAAAVLAAVMASPAAFADDGWQPNNIEFHGYFRSGVGQSRDGANIAWQKDKVGRLGNESETYGEIEFMATPWRAGDISFTIDTMLALDCNGHDSWEVVSSQTGSSDSNNSQGSTDVGLMQYNLQIRGLIPNDKNANLWVGKRYYKRYDHHIIDQKYINISGSGAGLEDWKIGPGQLSLAWVRKDTTAQALTVDYSNFDGNPAIKNRTMNVNVYDIRYAGSYWDGGWLEFMSSTFVPNSHNVHNDQGKAHFRYNNGTGEMVTIDIAQSWDGGYNKTTLQYGNGPLASSVFWMSGGWYNAGTDTDNSSGYALINGGRFRFGQSHFSVEHVEALLYGRHLSNGSYDGNGVFSNEHDGQKTDKMFKAVIRPAYQLSQYTGILAELGMYTWTTKYGDGTKANHQGQKYTLAYAIAPGDVLSTRPQLRFYVSYLHANHSDRVNSYDYDYNSKDNYNFGIQAEAWW